MTLSMKSYLTILIAAAAVACATLTTSCSGGGGDESGESFISTGTEFVAEDFLSGQSFVRLQVPTLGYIEMQCQGESAGNMATGTLRFNTLQALDISFDVTYQTLTETGGTKGWPGIQINFTGGYHAGNANSSYVLHYLHVLSAEEISNGIQSIQLGFLNGECAVEMCAARDSDNPPDFYYWSSTDEAYVRKDPADFKPYMWAQELFDGLVWVYRKK